MNEHLTKAVDCLEFARQHLCSMLTTASALEALVLMPMIAQAAQLKSQAEAMQAAVSAD